MNAPTPLRIMIIEDNNDHARILKWAFEQTNHTTNLTFFRDADAALGRLQGDGQSPAAAPDLIFLDYNLPRASGGEVLALLKANKNSKDVPVIVLSSSEREEDVRHAYELGASTYISKGVILNELRNSLQAVLDYWSKIAKLPRRS
ncbi:MAG: response regulator [Ignavibacterium sp.]